MIQSGGIMKNILEVNNLSAAAGEKLILNGISINVKQGETHVVMGPNGAGKSTLGNAIMGNPVYEITEGSILMDGEDITDISPDKRAKKGLFMSFQNPLEVSGITLESFIRETTKELTGQKLKIMAFHKKLDETLKALSMNEEYAQRELNVGFSGGEKKKSEILQMLMLEPKLAILDETDSGLDVDAVRTVSEGVAHFQEKTNGSLIIITHNIKLLKRIKVDHTHVIIKGRLIASGGAELITEINEHGFGKYEQMEAGE